MKKASKVSMLKNMISLASAEGKIIGVTFIKEDGTVRSMAFRKGVMTESVKGTRPEASKKADKTLKDGDKIRVWDMNKGWRTVNLATVTKIRVNGGTFRFDI